MPYIWPASTPGEGIQRIQLRLFDPSRFQLLTSFEYQDTTPGGSGITVAVPGDAGNDPPGTVGVTDLVSVPPFLWGLIASYGRQLPAALVHDHLYAALGEPGADRRAIKDLADGIFLRALTDPSLGDHRVPAVRARLLWAGLSVARYATVRRAKLIAVVLATGSCWVVAAASAELVGRLLPLHTVSAHPWLGWLFLALAVGLLGVAGIVNSGVAGPAGAVISGASVVAATLAALLGIWAGASSLPTEGPSTAALIWSMAGGVVVAGLAISLLPRPDRLLPLILAAAVPVAAPVAAITVPAQLILWGPDAVRHALGGVSAGPRPTVVR